MNKLPQNPYILLSIINTKLRDYYQSLNQLCEDLDEDEEEIKLILKTINYHYNNEKNQFLQN